jgi:hypothetical protein
VPTNAVAVDAEWDEQNGGWLMTQLHAPASGRVVVFCRRDLPARVRQGLAAEAKAQGLAAEAKALGITLHLIDRDDDTDLLRPALEDLFPDDPPGVVDLLLYFSPKDVEYTLGWAGWSAALDRGPGHAAPGPGGALGRGPHDPAAGASRLGRQG